MGIRETVSSRVVILLVKGTEASLYVEELMITNEVLEVKELGKTGFAQLLRSPLTLFGSNQDQFFCGGRINPESPID